MDVVRCALAALVRVATAGILVVGLSAVPAGAAPPVQGSGEGQITGLVITPIREAGGNRTEHRELTGVVEGSLDGTFVQEVIGTVHGNDRVTFRGTLVFTGTVEGCGEPDAVHTVTLGVAGRGEIVAPGHPVTVANVRVVGSNSVHITGQGTVHQDGAELRYEVRYQCH